MNTSRSVFRTCRFISELLSAHLIEESAGEGQGTSFIVELPQLRTSSSSDRRVDAVISDAREHEQAKLTTLADVTVLVIDDQADVRYCIGEVLRRAGATVQVAESVQEAIAAIQASEPHVVLCDIAMPHEDGFAFMRWIRAEGRAVPVLAITAFGGENNEERVLGAGFSGYIRKPVEPSDLSRAVAGAVRG